MSRRVVAVGVVAVLIVGVSLGVLMDRALSDAQTADQVRQQRAMVADVLDAAERIEAVVVEVEALAERTACVLLVNARTTVAAVRVLLADRSSPQVAPLVVDLEERLADLEAAVDGVCPEEEP